ncbi:hypothetical protein PW52_12875 [Tamlana sedimentorum]|uniref:DUF2306 domain-containing protein n=1 Tax=Neotamlana sedimentorum TaxID=1435349 RepID=A0A0D7W8H0_9FLAO|nr:hypothetical protein [Tamlana sedimentorum]KJD34983.1 hypothetical protein PW52_12875 [Tamlana sedimentorum]
MEKAYKNIGYIMLILVPLVILAFYKTYFGQFPDFNENTSALSHSKISIFDHIHVFFASLWILLFIIQPLLIRFRKYKSHKIIGKVSYFLFPILILSFIHPIFRILQADHAMLAYLPISDAVLLILFYVLAIYHKKDTPKHMRYIIGTAAVFIGPIFGRIGPYIFDLHPRTINNIKFIFIYLLFTGLIVLDKKYGRNFIPYIIIICGMIIKQILFNVLL